MINNQLVLLLNVIKTNGNINKLRRQKLSFKQIAELTDAAILIKYLAYIDDRITLTIEGETFLRENEALIKQRDKKEWIDPDFKNRIKPIEKNDVFLPSQNELSFLKELL